MTDRVRFRMDWGREFQSERGSDEVLETRKRRRQWGWRAEDIGRCKKMVWVIRLVM